MLPTFLIIGAQKAGTTSLWAYLKAHPDVYLCDSKEPGFFVEEIAWHNGVRWYEGLFAAADGARAIGEASTYYTMYPYFSRVPERIAGLLPEARLIYVMRDPVARMRSGYIQLLTSGEEHRPIREALLLDARYADISRYAMQLEQFYKWFPESRILLLTAEELRSHREQVVRRVCEFIGVDPDVNLDMSAEHNVSEFKQVPNRAGRLIYRLLREERVPAPVRRQLPALLQRPIVSRSIHPEEVTLDDDLRARLSDVLRPDLERLRRWMGSDFDGWGLLA